MRLASVVLCLAIGCSHSDDHSVPGDPCNDGGAYERFEVTDEACRAYVEAETRGQIVTDAAKAPTWTNPQTKVPVAPQPTFTWTKGTLAKSLWKRAINLLEKDAWAHGDTTGDAYVLSFKDKSGKEVHRVMTAFTTYTPAQKTWDTIRAGGTFTVTLTGVRFTVNAISSGTKPTASTPITVTVQ
jgi:hypothetical protein